MKCGVVYICYGPKAHTVASWSMDTLREFHPCLPMTVVDSNEPNGVNLSGFTNVQKSRWAKVHLYELSPFENTLYIDADTRIKQGSLLTVFDILTDGWDVAIVPSSNQGTDLLWHVSGEERETTLMELGHAALQLQGGVFGFRRNERVARFFEHWHWEWERWRDQDQAALLRALERSPVRVWLLGRPWNGGAIVGHQFGRARG